MYINMPVKCFYSSCAHLMFKKYAWNSELYLKLIVFLFDLACATVTRNFRITKGRTVGSIHQFPSERESSCSFLKSQRGTCTHYWSRWDFFPFTCILEFCYLYIFGHFRVIFLTITGDEHLQSLQEIMSELPDMKKYAIGSQQADLPPEFIAMDEVLLRTLPVPLSPACRGEQSLLDPVCYIYTSGTTGGLV